MSKTPSKLTYKGFDIIVNKQGTFYTHKSLGKDKVKVASVDEAKLQIDQLIKMMSDPMFKKMNKYSD